jgi:hypothetical protein
VLCLFLALVLRMFGGTINELKKNRQQNTSKLGPE